MTVSELIDRLERYSADGLPVRFFIGAECIELHITEEDVAEDGGVSFELSPDDDGPLTCPQCAFPSRPWP